MKDENETKRPDEVRDLVRDRYGKIAQSQTGGCCCGGGSVPELVSLKVGYTPTELQMAPSEANLGLGCGNPTAIDALQPGEVVVDLGSGAGIDAFIAAKKVGKEGRVIGVDMTDAMLERARETALRERIENVEFRKGRIEELPVEDGSVDVIISNCVVNLSPEKDKAFGEAFRVLRPGGRLLISDIVLDRPLPEAIRESIDAYVSCIAGASLREDYLRTIRDAGFDEVKVVSEASFAESLVGCCGGDETATLAEQLGLDLDVEEIRKVADGIRSVHISARRSS